MDKHYGWQEDRGSQSAGRFQNGQRWNERNRDDDRDVRGSRGGEHGGWDQNEGRYGDREQRWGSSGADFDRGEYMGEGDNYGGSRGFGGGQSGQRSQPGHAGQWSQADFGRNREFGNQGSNRPFRNEPFRGQGGNQGFSGGHYGGFANEGTSSQSPGYGPRSAQSWAQDDRDFQRQGYGGQSGPGYGRPSGQGFAGRGPKGYQQSDERIKEQVSDRLMDDDDVDATEIVIEVKNGEVTLTGSVNSRQEKRAAEDAADQTPGVREVQNLLRVQSRESSGGRSVSGQSGSAQSGNSSQSTSGGGRQDSFSKSQDSSSSQSKSKNSERE